MMSEGYIIMCTTCNLSSRIQFNYKVVARRTYVYCSTAKSYLYTYSNTLYVDVKGSEKNDSQF